MVEVTSRVKEHTVECSTSSTLCKPVFKQSCDGRDSDAGIVLAGNNSDVDQPVSCGSGIELERIYRKNRTPILPPIKINSFLGEIL